VSADTPYPFTDSARIAIIQARHEALHARALAVTPEHLALGVLHTLPQRVLDLLFPDPALLTTLVSALGGGPAPAPVIAQDISYEESAENVLGGAIKLAAEMPEGPDTHPLHILLGVLRPWSLSGDHATEPGAAALTLAATGLGETRLRSLVPRVRLLTPD
jgi:hypothetical protein